MPFYIFDYTFGKFFRLVQRTLIVSTPAGEKRISLDKSPTLWELLCLDSTREALEFVKSNMQEAIYFQSREDLFTWINSQFGKQFYGNKSSLILEFGVYTGKSINMIAEIFPKSRVVGFDSFYGLPESWSGFKYQGGFAGLFSTSGQIPIVNSNVDLQVGLFQESLPEFLTNFNSDTFRICLVHFDADLYSSTIFVLTKLEEFLEEDVIMVFDEFFNYPGWKNHEFRAFYEFLAVNKYDVQYLGFTEYSVCVRVKRKA